MSQPIKIAINGFGRIGRKIARLALEQSVGSEEIQIVGINDLSQPEQMIHLLKYDSVHGPIREEIRLEGKTLYLGRHQIQLTAEKDPSALPWENLEAKFIHECTGIFTDREKAALHLNAGAQKVIISAPAQNPDATFCMGVNDHQYNPSQHHVVSNASCTTNCLAPLVKVIDESLGVVFGTMLTVHSYTNDQQLLDLGHKDLRRARAAALSQIPTSTGAAKAVGLVLPHLKGKIDGLAIRVPTPNVSLIDFTCQTRKAGTVEELNAAFKRASNGALKGILGYSDEPLVSIDFNGCLNSATLDAGLTTIVGANLIKVIAWYDNESGFSARMLDLTRMMAKKEK